MKIAGVVVRRRKIVKGMILLILGVSLIHFSLFMWYTDHVKYARQISDEEVIQRAKDLGMINVKEYLENNK